MAEECWVILPVLLGFQYGSDSNASLIDTDQQYAVVSMCMGAGRYGGAIENLNR